MLNITVPYHVLHPKPYFFHYFLKVWDEAHDRVVVLSIKSNYSNFILHFSHFLSASSLRSAEVIGDHFVTFRGLILSGVTSLSHFISPILNLSMASAILR